ncbi:MAG TPA: indole-3-glycerol phosphate synthase TrpC [Actinomycetota bacterium]|nr:indole-3-glycerol phosphate synthase TrpC [Actinomycetota bacterium]
MGFLTDVLAQTRRDLADRPLDLSALEAAAAARPPARPWVASLRHGSPSVIAEVKRASPSAGDIARGVDPVAQARAYEAAGAAAISVLTEPRHFGGSLEDLARVRAAVQVPVLRKDFLIEPSQVLEARAAGADAVLVIASATDDAALLSLLERAAELGMGVLLESHGDADLERALATREEVVGVNARDLESLEVDVPAALARLRRIPADRAAVLESGIASRADAAAAVEAGASAILVGEALMRAPDPAAALRRLRGEEADG